MAQSFIIHLPANHSLNPLEKSLVVSWLVSCGLPISSTMSLANLSVVNEDLMGIKIEHIRQLLNELSYGAYAKGERVCILWQAESMTIPAQNALLKSLEEPPANTYLVLVTSQPTALLSTIRSRCVLVNADEGVVNEPATVDESLANVVEVLTSPRTTYSQLIEVASQYKERAEALQLVEQLITYFHTQSTYPNRQSTNTLTKLLQTQSYLQSNVNVRLALENCFFDIKAKIDI